MTTTRYLIARFAQAFGLIRRSQRLSDAASEMHLLREAEAHLGAAIWEKVAAIEALSVEYWNLRKLVKERNLIHERLTACQEKLNLAHDERAALLNNAPDVNEELQQERSRLLAELEQLAYQRDLIVSEARDVRRTHVGLKMKLEVLSKESGPSTHPDELVKVTQRLTELKARFAQLKQDRVRIGETIAVGDAKVDAIDDQLKSLRDERRQHASSAFQIIGVGNREISLMRAESGVLDTQMRQLYAEIGRYVSRHSHTDAACAAAASELQGLVDVMRALRRSIALNHRLAGTT